MSPTLRVISSRATAALLPPLLEHCCVPLGEPFDYLSMGGVDALARIRASVPASEPSEGGFDIAVLERSALEALADESLIIRSTLTDLALSHTAIATRHGEPQPAVATIAELLATLRTVRSIGYSTGPSGRELLRFLERSGLLPELVGRLIQAPPGVPVARLIAEGKVSIGFQQLSELRGFPGVDVLGPLPPGAEIDTLFGVAVCRASIIADRAARILARMVAAETLPIRRRFGFDDPPSHFPAGNSHS